MVYRFLYDLTHRILLGAWNYASWRRPISHYRELVRSVSPDWFLSGQGDYIERNKEGLHRVRRTRKVCLTNLHMNLFHLQIWTELLHSNSSTKQRNWTWCWLITPFHGDYLSLRQTKAKTGATGHYQKRLEIKFIEKAINNGF